MLTFFLHFVHFLGGSWEPCWASWGSLGKPLDPKTCKNQVFFNGFEKAVFRSLKLLMTLLGSSCCFLGKSDPKMGFRNGYQKWSFKTSKNDFVFESFCVFNFLCFQFLVPFLSIFGNHFGAHFGTRSAKEGARWAQESHQELQRAKKLHFQKP